MTCFAIHIRNDTLISLKVSAERAFAKYKTRSSSKENCIQVYGKAIQQATTSQVLIHSQHAINNT